MTRLVASILCGVVALIGCAGTASAMTIEKIVSPSGIEAWLVREKAVPLVTLNYAFHGGATQDGADKAGTANLAADLLDEGAGNLDSKAYHERLENHAIELGFQVGRDYIHGSLRALTEHRDEAFELLRLALSSPRFDADAVERVRGQQLAALQRDTTNPNDLASRRWWQTAFPDHPYGRETKGTLETVPRITAGDLRDYVRRVFARNELKVSIVGDVDAKTAGSERTRTDLLRLRGARAGRSTQPLHPDEAFWAEQGTGSLALLRYEAVRTSVDPKATLLAFLESGYQAGAGTSGWDQASLKSSWCPAPPALSDLLAS